MSSVNKAFIIGNVGKAPEIREFNSGSRIATFSIATSDSWKDKETGERKERTEWHSIVIRNENVISIVERFVTKGAKVCVEGQIQTRKWQDSDGNDRYSTEIVVQGYHGKLTLLSNPSSGDTEDGEESAPRRATRPSRTHKPELKHQDAVLDDDLPF